VAFSESLSFQAVLQIRALQIFWQKNSCSEKEMEGVAKWLHEEELEYLATQDTHVSLNCLVLLHCIMY